MGSQTVAETIALCGGEGITEYFRELVEDALDHQHVEVDDPTAYYVVHMLSAFARYDPSRGDAFHSDDPLAIRLARALETAGGEQRRQLQQVGDAALFLSGFFPGRLRRSLVDVDYFMTLGGHAYGSLSRVTDRSLAPIFLELAERFAALVDVLGEVSERASLGPSHDLLRLYERWLQTGSARLGRQLAAQGVVPVASASRRVQ